MSVRVLRSSPFQLCFCYKYPANIPLEVAEAMQWPKVRRAAPTPSPINLPSLLPCQMVTVKGLNDFISLALSHAPRTIRA